MRIVIAILTLFWVFGAKAQNQKPLYTKMVYFEFGKYEIRPTETRTLTAFLKAIKAQEAGYTISLTGHTDNIDSDPYNQVLGLNRAKAVKEFLVKKGVPANYIQVASKGKKAAIKDNTTDSGRAMNRRVEMLLFAGKPGGGTQPDGGLKLVGSLYDMDTDSLVTGDITITIQNPLEVDREKIKQHKLTKTYAQTPIAGRTYTVYINAPGYRAESYTVTIGEDKKTGIIRQDAYLKKLVIKKRFNYERIYFVPNKDEFQPTAHAELQKLLIFMQSDSLSNVEIRGHVNYAKNRPPMTAFEEYIFYDLSLRRAKAVYNYLVKFGVNKKRMSYRGMSNTEMVLPYAQSMEDCQRNMRVEILVLE